MRDHPAIPDGIEAVVLDFDGTLADTTPSHEQAPRAALQPHGLGLDPGWYLRHAGLSIRDLLAELPGARQLPHDEIIQQSRTHLLATVHYITPIDCVVTLLRAARRAGLPCAIASGASRLLVQPGLEALGLRAEFAAVIAREDVPRGKPAPDLYIEAARRLDVPPGHCLAVDDAPDGVTAARAAGMHVLTLAGGHLAPADEDKEGAGHSGSRAGALMSCRTPRHGERGPAATYETTVAPPQAAHDPIAPDATPARSKIPPSDGLKPSHQGSTMPVLHSTKNLEVIEPPTAAREGVGVFEYTDNFTVFHYGRMPDLIPGKGEAICRMAVFNFMMLEAAGVPTHFRRFIAPSRIEFDLARVPGLDAGAPTLGARNYLVPVQVLFRNELPQGSSVHHRLAVGTLTPSDLGLRDVPAVGEELGHPLIEYATILDETNRFIGASEAQRLAGLSDEQFQEMQDTTVKVNEVITGHASELGLSHCDGKVEYLVSGDARIVVADSPGTPDESRLMFNGVHCGKQVIRNWYVAQGLEVPVQRLIADGIPRRQWPKPAPLPPGFMPVMSDMYRSLSEAWTGERVWNAPDLQAATQAVRRLTGR
jgi:phosphoribosylaminoimidazole-succinocarboxamide synthase